MAEHEPARWPNHAFSPRHPQLALLQRAMHSRRQLLGLTYVDLAARTKGLTEELLEHLETEEHVVAFARWQLDQLDDALRWRPGTAEDLVIGRIEAPRAADELT